MCDTIVLPDGTEISLLPLPFIYEKENGKLTERLPKHSQSCLCQFPKESIEFWLKGQFPDCDVAYDVGFGEWTITKKA